MNLIMENFNRIMIQKHDVKQRSLEWEKLRVGKVGGSEALGAIAITGAGGAAINGVITDAGSLAVTGATALGSVGITTSGTQTYTGAVTQSAVSVLTTSNSNITFGSTLVGNGGDKENLTMASLPAPPTAPIN